MFLYQSRLLKAETTNGILNAQTLMANLYSTNLNALGTQAALICSVTYISINLSYVPVTIKANYFSLGYQTCYAISLSAALIMVSHSLLASLLGPTKSLIGLIR
jgi:hypothetical protein